MITLTKEQRKLLNRTVLQARDIAESGARKALHTIGVVDSDVPSHLSPEQRELRRALRAQAKQLGDIENPQKPGYYSISHLSEKIAYDQWHRMLFARFLAENNLLISPRHQLAVTLDECNDLAPELGLRDGWQVASTFAAEMLPQIFRADEPSGQIGFAPEDRLALQNLVVELPGEIFLSDDALGWVYQFWQEKRKDEVNRSEKKIGADELAPVTQLFTEDYMVLFLLHNTLGSWWAGKHKGKFKGLSTEDECRKAMALNGIEWTYLRFIKDEKSGEWVPAAGTFDGWPRTAKELRVLDPCMGSGHFLVFALPILVAFRMEEEKISKEQACDAVFKENLFGLEIDMRCTQIGVFNLALKSWKMAGYRSLPQMNIACCGLGINATKEEWLKLADGNDRLEVGLEKLYDLFRQAPVLGSLINPATIQASKYKPEISDFFSASYAELRPLFEKALAKETQDETIHEMAVIARGLAKAAELLAGQYTLVTTNVPYLGRGKQDEILKQYLEIHYKLGKADLATAFVQRSLEFCKKDGTTALVTPQNWLFLTSYKKFRERLLKNDTWHLIARLGPGAFETISGEVVKAILISLSRGNSANESGGQAGSTKNTKNEPDLFASFVHNKIRGVDVSEPRAAAEKAAQLQTAEIKSVEQAKQLENPDVRVVLEEDSGEYHLLGEYADSLTGAHTLDIERFRIYFWELGRVTKKWNLHASTPVAGKHYSGMEYVSFTREAGEAFANLAAAMKEEGFLGGWLSGNKAWGKLGIACSWMHQLPVSIYLGTVYDNSAAAIIPYKKELIPAIWCFCSSPEYSAGVRKINQKVQVANSTLVKVPFDLDHWTKVAEEKYPNGLPEPYTNDPTQWIFHGHPCGSVIWDEEKKWTAHGPLRTDDSVLQVAIARLLGYRWPAESDDEMRLSERARELVKRCDELLSFADDDGIVCISPIIGEQPAAERLRELLAAAYGTQWNSDTQAQLLNEVGYEGKNLEDWLRDGFFEQHCKLFHNRPFIWQIWDGRKDGFSVLVNYHKLDRQTLEKLTYTYLGDWIARQKRAVDAGEEGSDARLIAAQELKNKLEKILEGEPPYDIFVRWKPIEKQPIGWEPDLNDGVRMNIRPFYNAGILRKNPNINWKKDRGKDVQSAPWYHMFKGDRINDHHLTNDDKRKARQKGDVTNG